LKQYYKYINVEKNNPNKLRKKISKKNEDLNDEVSEIFKQRSDV